MTLSEYGIKYPTFACLVFSEIVNQIFCQNWSVRSDTGFLATLAVMWTIDSVIEHSMGNSETVLCLQCFDAVGWAAGRATGL